MGKASRWFRSILGLKKPHPTHPPKESKRRWSFVKSTTKRDTSLCDPATSDENDIQVDPNKHAIAVAAATAAVAEAAVAAAHAAAEVVRLTSSGRCANNLPEYVSGRGAVVVGGYDENFAAVMIQSAFRGYLVSSVSYSFPVGPVYRTPVSVFVFAFGIW